MLKNICLTVSKHSAELRRGKHLKEMCSKVKHDIYCAVDIGGTKILLLLLDKDGQVLSRIKENTPKASDPDHLVKAVKCLIDDSLDKLGLSAQEYPTAVGICTAGFLNHRTQLVHHSGNLNWFDPVPLQNLMEKSLQRQVLIENDANAAVLGEVYYGAARGHRDAIYVTISTGIGGGLFLDNRLYRGSFGFAGEVGHIKPYGKGRECNCGGYDCLETWASGSAIARNAASLWDREDFHGQEITTSEVFDQAAAGNVLAEKIINHAAENIGRALSNLAAILNPSIIVLGGGVIYHRKDFLAKIIERVKIDTPGPSGKITPLEIVGAQLDPESGIWGMYALLTGQVVD